MALLTLPPTLNCSNSWASLPTPPPAFHCPYNSGVSAILSLLPSSLSPLLSLSSSLGPLSLSLLCPHPRLPLLLSTSLFPSWHVWCTTFSLLWVLLDASDCTFPHIYNKKCSPQPHLREIWYSVYTSGATPSVSDIHIFISWLGSGCPGAH